MSTPPTDAAVLGLQPSQDGVSAHQASDRGAGLAILFSTLGLLGLRLLLTIPRPNPIVVLDEIGYLTNARVLDGGTAGQLSAAPFYRGGYSLLIAPLMGLSNDPEVIYRLVLVVNAVLVASLCPLLFLLLTRGFGISARRAVWPAVAAAAYPTVTITSQGAMSENLLLPLTTAWLLSFAYLLRSRGERPRAGSAVAVGLIAAALYAVHGRMVVTVILSALGLVLLAVRRRITVTATGLGLVALGLGLAGAQALNNHLVDANYAGRHLDETKGQLSALGQVDSALSVARNLVGQTWYVLVATLGIALLLLASRGPGGLMRLWRRDAEVADLLLGLLLATTAGLLVLSALWFNDIIRSDMLVYGRYVDVAVPPLLAIGLATLAEGRLDVNPRALVAMLTGLTAAVVVLRLTIDVPGGEMHWNPGGLTSRLGTVPPSWLVEAIVLGAAFTGVLAMVVKRSLVRRNTIVAAFAVFTGAALTLRLVLDVPEGGNRWMVASLPARTENLVPWPLAAAGLVAAAVMCAMVASSRRWPRVLAPAALLLFLPITAYSENFVVDYTRAAYPSGWTSPQKALESRGAKVVAYDMDHTNLVAQAYQWFLPNTHVVLFKGRSQRPPSRYVISSSKWPQEHPGGVATALWKDPARDETLWSVGG